MKPEDKEAYRKACWEWATNSGGKDLGEYMFKAALDHRDAQPAAQGDAVHFRAVLCSEQRDKALGVVPKTVGFVDKKAAEQFILEQRDFKGWKYNLESLYTEAPAVAVNEQLLEVLRLIRGKHVCGALTLPEADLERTNDAIAAAEAAKGGV